MSSNTKLKEILSEMKKKNVTITLQDLDEMRKELEEEEARATPSDGKLKSENAYLLEMLDQLKQVRARMASIHEMLKLQIRTNLEKAEELMKQSQPAV